MACLASSWLKGGLKCRTWAEIHNEIEQLIGNHQCFSKRKKKEKNLEEVKMKQVSSHK